jgi:hypothetical protein
MELNVKYFVILGYLSNFRASVLNPQLASSMLPVQRFRLLANKFEIRKCILSLFLGRPNGMTKQF